jgi:anti-sigma B factor antagonist
VRELRDVEIRPEWLDENSSFTTVAGSLDLDGAAELKRVLTDFREGGANRFVLDLSRVRFIDSTGLGVLIGLNRQLRGRGALVITAPSPAVTRLLQVTGVARLSELGRRHRVPRATTPPGDRGPAVSAGCPTRPQTIQRDPAGAESPSIRGPTGPFDPAQR